MALAYNSGEGLGVPSEQFDGSIDKSTDQDAEVIALYQDWETIGEKWRSGYPTPPSPEKFASLSKGDTQIWRNRFRDLARNTLEYEFSQGVEWLMIDLSTGNIMIEEMEHGYPDNDAWGSIVGQRRHRPAMFTPANLDL